MKKTLLIILMVALTLFCACGTNSKNDIVGVWESSGERLIFGNYIEFFSNGTHETDVNGLSGNYSIEGDKLLINGNLYSKTLSFEISDNGNKLVLTGSAGYSKTYHRVK